jgi:nitroreductase
MADVTETMVQDRVLQDAVMLACRAPSLHNSQPWRWVSDGAVLHLFADHMRLMLAADSSGRELLLSCGAVLDHLRVAMAAAGWDTNVERFPDPHQPDHLAALTFTPTDVVTDARRRRAEAILLRRTDRLPFDAPNHWAETESRLRLAVVPHLVMTDVVLERDRPALAAASRLTETLRASDPSYQTELEWWTSPFASNDSVPPSALVSASEAGRTDVARAFPSAARSDRRLDTGADRSKIFVLSTAHEDARLDVLRCGEALSAVLLEATLAGLATCTLTHMTEVMPSRDIIRQLTGQIGSPQLLIRIGVAPSNPQPLPATPRRPLAEVLVAHR